VHLVLAFGLLLAFGALVSARAHRSVLSTTVVFLLAGVAVGPTGFGWASVDPQGDLLFTVAEIALFVVLFTDAMRLPLRELAPAWRLGGRALFIGMPLTIGLLVVTAHLVLGLPWMQALLVAAVLSPTDPVLAEAIIGGERIPGSIKTTLNVESGLNDGLALPVVLLTIAALNDTGPSRFVVLAEMAGGVVIGIVVALVVLWLERLRVFGSAQRYEPLLLIAIGVIVFAGDLALHANAFLGAFAAGVTVATVAEHRAKAFERLGATATELLKLFAVFLLGIVLSPPSSTASICACSASSRSRCSWPDPSPSTSG
jgi:NhaP-type Na+/H+ or K+/H+ antiporter